MKKTTGVILFSLAMGLLLARPAPVAADFNWDVCNNNSLATCASVAVMFNNSNSITVTVTNTSASGLLTNFGLGGLFGPGFTTLSSSSQPLKWKSQVWNGDLLVQGPGLANGQSAQFTFNFSGTLTGEAFVASLNGAGIAETSGDPDPEGDEGPIEGDGLGPDPEDFGTTHAPEPTTLLLVGTGLAGIAAARRRRKDQEL